MRHLEGIRVDGKVLDEPPPSVPGGGDDRRVMARISD